MGMWSIFLPVFISRAFRKPKSAQRNIQVRERRKSNEIRTRAAPDRRVVLVYQFECLGSPLDRIDDPIELHSALGILLELIFSVDRARLGADNFDAEIRRPVDGIVFLDEVRTIRGKDNDVRTADVELPEDRV